MNRSNPLRFAYWFGTIDARPVALFRILLALLLLKNALYHLPLAPLFYSDNGVLPRSALFDGLVRVHRFSLLDAVGQDWLALLVFVVWIAVLLALLVGYRSRLMAVLNFLLILSIHERNPYIITGADSLMRVMSFWLMFAPLAEHYALDAILRRRVGTYDVSDNSPSDDRRAAFALPLRLMQWQFVIVYMINAYLKLIGAVWQQGDALHYVLQSETVLLPFGAWMATWPPQVLRLMTHSVIAVEVLIPLLLLSPLWWRSSRLLAFTLGLMLHGGIALALAIPDFSLLMLICYVLFFDGRWFAPLTRIWNRLLAQPFIAARSQPLLDYLIQHTTLKPRQPVNRSGLSLLLLPMFVLVIAWNVSYASSYARPDDPLPYVPGSAVIDTIGLWQFWDMYAPLPVQYDGWIRVIGYFENGYSYDLFSERATHDLTPTQWRWGPFMRWEKYEENAYRWQEAALLRAWARYYCRTFNNEQQRIAGTRLATLEIVMRVTDFHAPDAPTNEPYNLVLWSHWCLPEYADRVGE